MNTSRTEPWLQYWYRKPQARVRLFCFPYAGGGASIFRSWSDLLPQEIEVCPVQLPGREGRLVEQPFSEIEGLVEALTRVLPTYLDRPYAFFGHSMGALIGFELIRSLRRLGSNLEPMHLFASGHRAPHLPDPDPPTHALPEPEFVAELRRLKGTSEEVLQSRELLRLFLPLLRADMTLCENYLFRAGQPLICPISVFGGLEDPEVHRSSLSAWEKHTEKAFTLRFFKGGHFFLHTEQAALLRALAYDLLQALWGVENSLKGVSHL